MTTEPRDFSAALVRDLRKEAERYIAAEALNVDNSHAKAARIMRGLLDEIERLENRRA